MTAINDTEPDAVAHTCTAGLPESDKFPCRACGTKPDAAESTTQQRVDIGELLIAMKYAIEKMGKRNTHRGIMVTAGSVLIYLIAENQRLNEQLNQALLAQVP